MSNLVAKAYYFLWHTVLKLPKPITHITREDAKENPLLYIVLALLLGIILVKWGKEHWWQSVIWLGIGILLGHLFWT